MRLARSLPLVLLLGACRFQVEGLPAVAGGGGDLATGSDAAIGDDLASDAAVDGALADLATPDLAMVDLAMADLAAPDLTTPDLSTRDLAMPDLAMPDLAMPDLAMPDLLVLPPSLTLVTPAAGPTTGGTSLVLSGAHFLAGATLTIDGIATPAQLVSSTQLTAPAPADPGALGKVVVTVRNPDGQTASGMLFSYYAGTVTFAASAVTGGGAAAAVAIADLDGNGANDVALVDGSQLQGASDVLVFVGNGNGTFKTPVGYTSDNDPNGVAVGDFNRDGKLDLFVANFGQSVGDVSLLLGAGSATFPTHCEIFAGAGAQNPIYAAVGDLDGDSRADGVVADFGASEVSVFLGQGAAPGFAGPTAFATSGSPRALALGDVNGDTRLDLVVASFATGDVDLLTGKGDGTFNGKTTITPVCTTSGASGFGARGIALGDMSGDGALDIVVTCYGDNLVKVLVNSGTGGFSGGGAASFSTGAGANPRGVALADFDGDGSLDVGAALETAGAVGVYLTRGGSYGATSIVTPVCTGAYHLAAGRLDADSRPDLAVACNGTGQLGVLLDRAQ